MLNACRRVLVRTLIAVFCVVMVPGPSFAADDDAKLNSPITDKWALLVGIGKFNDQRIPTLKYAAKDAIDFSKYLVEKKNFAPDHVIVLTDEQATRANILSKLGGTWLPRLARPTDLVVLYFSSHGSPADMDAADVNYLVAHDTDVDNLFATGIAMQELAQMIKARVHSDRVVILLDACHSGATEVGGKGISRVGNFDAEQISQGTGQLVISSSSSNQRSWESTDSPNGVFTKYLMKALDKNGPTTTLSDAFDSLKSGVEQEVLHAHGTLQTPVLKSKWQGNNLILAAKPSEPANVPTEMLPKSVTTSGVVPSRSTIGGATAPSATTPSPSMPSATRSGAPQTPGATSNQIGFVDKTILVSHFSMARDSANQLKLMESDLSSFVSGCNKHYEQLTQAGKTADELAEYKQSAQKRIEVRASIIQRKAKEMEDALQRSIDSAVQRELTERNLGRVTYEAAEKGNAVDITADVIRRLNQAPARIGF